MFLSIRIPPVYVNIIAQKYRFVKHFTKLLYLHPREDAVFVFVRSSDIMKILKFNIMKGKTTAVFTVII